MKANEAPKKIFVNPHALQNSGYNSKDYMFIHDSVFDESKCTIEYTRTDVFIEKAREWFEMQNEGVDSCGNYKCDMTDFEDFKNYMKGK